MGVPGSIGTVAATFASVLLAGVLAAVGVRAADPAGGGAVSTSHDRPFRSDVVRIVLKSPDTGPHGAEIEYKVRMKAGATLVYSWKVDDLAEADEFYFDFHGETVPTPERPDPQVIDYWKDTRDSASGALTAPIDGVHGWYFQNQSAGTVTVTVRMSGFYDLVEPGAYGNEGGIVAMPIRD